MPIRLRKCLPPPIDPAGLHFVICAWQIREAVPPQAEAIRRLGIGLRGTAGDESCVAKMPIFVNIGGKIRRHRSPIVQVKYGTSTATDHFIRCLAQSER